MFYQKPLVGVAPYPARLLDVFLLDGVVEVVFVLISYLLMQLGCLVILILFLLLALPTLVGDVDVGGLDMSDECVVKGAVVDADGHPNMVHSF